MVVTRISKPSKMGLGKLGTDLIGARAFQELVPNCVTGAAKGAAVSVKVAAVEEPGPRPASPRHQACKAALLQRGVQRGFTEGITDVPEEEARVPSNPFGRHLFKPLPVSHLEVKFQLPWRVVGQAPLAPFIVSQYEGRRPRPPKSRQRKESGTDGASHL